MKKVLILFFLSLFFGLPTIVQAQQLSERWVCLKALHCRPANKKIPAGYKDEDFTDCTTIKDGHGAKISEDPSAPPLANEKTYIVECVAGTGGQTCTTGNPSSDQTIYGKDNTKMAGYTFRHMSPNDSQPVTSGANGKLGPYEWMSIIRPSKEHKFMALNYWVPSATQAFTAMGALQQGTIDFDFATAEKDCISLKWDPYGRVFDSQTLEPIIGATVNLSMKRTDGNFAPVTTADVVGGNIINPQITLEDGKFSYVVEDGTYKLNIAGTGLIFPIADISQLHPNYTKIYSDIYPTSTGDEIVQAGEIQHRDIPVKTATPTNNTPKLMEYFYEARPVTEKVVVEGRVSHPFTDIIAYSVKPSTGSALTVRYRQVGNVKADKFGDFKLEIDQSTFESDESFGEVELVKTDLQTLTKNNFFKNIISSLNRLVKKVQAETKVTTLKFDPIPAYLEGYAYDSSGQAIADATVGVYLTFSNKPYYQTKADEKGYFKITSENLPTMQYEIKYTSPLGSFAKISTSKFISQNQKYLAENKIDLHSYKNSQGKTIAKPTITSTINSSGTNQRGNPTQQKGLEKSNNGLIIVLSLFFLLILLILLVVFLLKKNKQIVPPESNLT